MLSDEEKKAIEELKNKKADYFMISDLTGKTLLNIIEKQSKEIEELKEENLIQRKRLNDVFDRGWIHKDKIKVKIEELDKEEKEKLKGTKGQDRYAIKQEYMYKRSVLQSLLEKE